MFLSIKLIFQASFKNINEDLRKCKFPDEGELELFSHYTKSNCELECAWKKAEEICGCRPWHVPSLGTSKTCFIFGISCFDQVMKKIEKDKMKISCQCSDDCVYNLYAIGQEKVIIERTSPQVYGESAEFGTIGTDTIDGIDHSNTYLYNMGNNY